MNTILIKEVLYTLSRSAYFFVYKTIFRFRKSIFVLDVPIPETVLLYLTLP